MKGKNATDGTNGSNELQTLAKHAICKALGIPHSEIRIPHSRKAVAA